MNVSTLIVINLFVILFVLLISVYTIIKMKRIEDKTADVSANDIIAFVEQMREMVLESEHAAEILDSSIKEREEVLDDLASLVESRINQFEAIINNNTDIIRITTNELTETDNDRKAKEIATQNEIDTLRKNLEQERLFKEKLILELEEKEKEICALLNSEKMLKEKLVKEKNAFEKIIEEIKQNNKPKEIRINNIPQKVIKRAEPKTSPETPIVAAKPTIVAQSIVKTTEEVLRTRTEPILSQQVQNRIPVDKPKIIKSRTDEVKTPKIHVTLASKESMPADTQTEIYKLLFEGLTEKQIAEKLGLTINDVEKALNPGSIK